MIWAGVVELGRIAAGDKPLTVEETETAEAHASDFADFAASRLSLSSTSASHSSQVASEFRRYHTRHRTFDADLPEAVDNVSDAAIVRLLRTWCKQNGAEGVTSAGFARGVEVKEGGGLGFERGI